MKITVDACELRCEVYVEIENGKVDDFEVHKVSMGLGKEWIDITAAIERYNKFQEVKDLIAYEDVQNEVNNITKNKNAA